MEKITSHEVRPMPGKKYASPDLNAFSEHFRSSEGYENEVLDNLLEDTNEDTVLRILAHFNENLKDGAEKLKVAISENNSETVWKTAHKMAGSAELLGFRDFAHKSRELSRVMRAALDFNAHAVEIEEYLENTANLSSEISSTCQGLNSFL